ncbi:hypothetical protein [Streptomyces sp. SAI-170]|uniref:hypothetical protein n=1 Tax=Streptomyces sp. SAI-170 TaxID=3377729 RepID=UPI003C7A9F89
MFGEPITADLTLGMDAFTHSLVAFRLTPGSDASIEVAMLLRDVMLPLPMRPDWTPDMEWHYPGVPAALVTEFAGHPVAGRPFFAPETVTSDHGSVYKNHHLVRVARTLGMVVLPARAMRPQDKAACEAPATSPTTAHASPSRPIAGLKSPSAKPSSPHDRPKPETTPNSTRHGARTGSPSGTGSGRTRCPSTSS